MTAIWTHSYTKGQRIFSSLYSLVDIQPIIQHTPTLLPTSPTLVSGRCGRYGTSTIYHTIRCMVSWNLDANSSRTLSHFSFCSPLAGRGLHIIFVFRNRTHHDVGISVSPQQFNSNNSDNPHRILLRGLWNHPSCPFCASSCTGRIQDSSSELNIERSRHRDRLLCRQKLMVLHRGM